VEPEQSSRARRAVALIAAVLVALVVVGVVYLRSTNSSAPRAAATASSSGPTVNPGPMHWLSANTGGVALRTHPIDKYEETLYHTTDGGHHWQRQFSFVGFLTLLISVPTAIASTLQADGRSPSSVMGEGNR
jgi:hypothetical protein